MARKGKKYREAAAKLERRPYPLDEALGIVKDAAFAGFDETVEVAMRLGVNPRHADPHSPCLMKNCWLDDRYRRRRCQLARDRNGYSHYGMTARNGGAKCRMLRIGRATMPPPSATPALRRASFPCP